MDKETLFGAIEKGSQSEVNELVSEEMKPKLRNKIQEAENEAAKNLLKEEVQVDEDLYDEVFRVVAEHLNFDPENMDEAGEEAKDEFFSMVDSCWDEEENKIPDTCPDDLTDKIVKELNLESYDMRHFPNATKLEERDLPAPEGGSDHKRTADNRSVVDQLNPDQLANMVANVFELSPNKTSEFLQKYEVNVDRSTSTDVVRQTLQNSPGERQMKDIAGDMLGDSEFGRIMQQLLNSRGSLVKDPTNFDGPPPSSQNNSKV